MAKEVNRYVVKNENTPSMGNITEEKEAEMQEVIEYFKVVIGALGYKVFVPVVEKKSLEINVNDETINNSIELFIGINSRDEGCIKATGVQTNEGFVVLKGSKIKANCADTVEKSIKKRREEVLNSEKYIDENNCLKENMLFTSPSYAASFVVGTRANGRAVWKTKEGKSLNDLKL